MLVKHADLSDTGWLRRDDHEEMQLRQVREGVWCEYRYLPTLLGEGIATHSVSVVRILLDSGGDPNSTVEKNCALGMNCQLGNTSRLTAISKAICTGDVAMVELLRSAGADLHFSANLRIAHTSLQLAVELGHATIIQFLLDHGVDVNAPPCDFAGGTALQFAAKAGSVGTAELLLQYGADVNAQGSRYQGRTAFEYAAEYGRMDMLLLLFHKGVDIVSDGGEQVQRACKLAERNGQIASKSLVMKLAEAKGLYAFSMGHGSNVESGDVGNLPVGGGWSICES